MNHGALKRWNSCPGELRIPETAPSDIKRLHIYDFDNTLYKSPGPNRILYTNQTYGKLLGGSNGAMDSWWSNPAFLNESFKESIAQQGTDYWNDTIVNLARDSYVDPKTVSIVLTGRTEEKFSELVQKMLAVTRKLKYEPQPRDDSADLLKFNAVCLKKRDAGLGTYKHTFDAKVTCIQSFIDNYPNLQEITIYDDRAKQVGLFKSRFFDMRPRPRFQWFVVQVPPMSISLDSTMEYQLVEEMIRKYSQAAVADPSAPIVRYEIKWTPKCTGFFLSVKSQKTLLVQAFKCLQRLKITKVHNLAEYPMYIPICRPGESLSLNTVAQIFMNADSEANMAINPQFLSKFYNQIDPKNRYHVEFIVTHYAVERPNTKAKQGNLYYKAIPKDKGTKIKTVFGNDTPLLVTGHIMEDFKDANILYDLNDWTMQQRHMKWSLLQEPITIQTTFGIYSKMKF